MPVNQPPKSWMQAPVGGAPRTRAIMLTIVLVITALYLIAPLAFIVTSAFSAGIEVFLRNLSDPATLSAIWLTTLTAIVVVPINILFGIAAAWAVTKFEFPGRTLLIALIELPYSISPIVAGVAYLFVYGSQGLFGPFLQEHDIKIMFAIPGIFLVSMFVTAPFVARELIPLMQVQGIDEEEAAVTLGASGFQMLRRITLPNVRWAIIYGAILCNARVMGEFGAVSVVSGNIRGQTMTVPLQIQLLYHDYNVIGAFGAATVLTAMALTTVLIKVLIERFGHKDHRTPQL
jgi:sulfate/thiosulfate transport system permease protein